MTKPSTPYEAYKFIDAKGHAFNDEILVEAPIQININDQAFTVVMATPGSELELAVGLLYAEDIIKNNQDYKHHLQVNDLGQISCNFQIKPENLGSGYKNKRSLLSLSSCGICGRQDLSDLMQEKIEKLNKSTLEIKQIPSLFETFENHQKLFKTTGGSHAAALFDGCGELLIIKEDIGRHNAVDKCIGSLLIQGKLNEAQIMLVSGRVSYEIITKAFRGKIPNVLSVSACSSLAIDMAKEFGINLIGFNRGNRATRYS
ncbi:MAG: formate dehydrogenase accessory sulfurtransferase FdhD [Flavobacteriaceae bacterium]